MRLDQDRPRPRCDAVVILRRSGDPVAAVPWLLSPPGPEETIRGFAVEIDRDQESLPIIREKALSYRRVAGDRSFYARYGRMPVPLWVVPSRRRAGAIHAVWAESWLDGRWYITTDDELAELRFVQWSAGQQRVVGLLDGWGV